MLLVVGHWWGVFFLPLRLVKDDARRVDVLGFSACMRDSHGHENRGHGNKLHRQNGRKSHVPRAMGVLQWPVLAEWHRNAGEAVAGHLLFVVPLN